MAGRGGPRPRKGRPPTPAAEMERRYRAVAALAGCMSFCEALASVPGARDNLRRWGPVRSRELKHLFPRPVQPHVLQAREDTDRIFMLLVELAPQGRSFAATVAALGRPLWVRKRFSPAQQARLRALYPPFRRGRKPVEPRRVHAVRMLALAMAADPKVVGGLAGFHALHGTWSWPRYLTREEYAALRTRYAGRPYVPSPHRKCWTPD